MQSVVLNVDVKQFDDVVRGIDFYFRFARLLGISHVGTSADAYLLEIAGTDFFGHIVVATFDAFAISETVVSGERTGLCADGHYEDQKDRCYSFHIFCF